MNTAYQQKVCLYLVLIGLFFLPSSCSLYSLKTQQTVILQNLTITDFRTKFEGKSWGNANTSADSEICVRFDTDKTIKVKTSVQGQFAVVGSWTFVADSSQTKGTLTIQNNAGITAGYEWPSLQVFVEFQGQRLHLVS